MFEATGLKWTETYFGTNKEAAAVRSQAWGISSGTGRWTETRRALAILFMVGLGESVSWSLVGLKEAFGTHLEENQKDVIKSYRKGNACYTVAERFATPLPRVA